MVIVHWYEVIVPSTIRTILCKMLRAVTFSTLASIKAEVLRTINPYSFLKWIFLSDFSSLLPSILRDFHLRILLFRRCLELVLTSFFVYKLPLHQHPLLLLPFDIPPTPFTCAFLVYWITRMLQAHSPLSLFPSFTYVPFTFLADTILIWLANMRFSHLLSILRYLVNNPFKHFIQPFTIVSFHWSLMLEEPT